MEEIARVNISDLVAEKLMLGIRNGSYKPGEQLPPHEELCEKWKVSRVTLREALKKLEVLKFVKIIQGKGTFVLELGTNNSQDEGFIQPHFEKESMLSLIEARKAIEIVLARFAAIRHDEQGIAELEALVVKMEELVKANDSLGYAIIDFQFHKKIGVLAKNNVLLFVLEKIQKQILDQQRSMFEYGKEIPSLEKSLLDHKKICEMIKKRDAAMSEKTMEKHLSNVEERIRKGYLKDNITQDKKNA
jgi:GntR family transcriptional repressor for pyruvate dehydrogenase complex